MQGSDAVQGRWNVPFTKRSRVFTARGIGGCLAFFLLLSGVALAQGTLHVKVTGAPIVAFDPKRDGCEGHDVPDAPLRAFRDEAGSIVAFGLHYENRRLKGPDFRALKIECNVVFRGSGSGEPSAYDDKSWITATWTEDGRTIHALAHHEFQAHRHRGRCAFPAYMQCWWNAILAIRSEDGGQNFRKEEPPVMAASPEPSEVGQGRHRGFFNPSNIIPHAGAHYVLVGTTGWEGQRSGVCLFRTEAVQRPGGWRAYDGKGFGAHFPDPYLGETANPATCAPIAPFPAPVGAVVRHRGTNTFLAVFQAEKGTPDGFGGRYAQSGFYIARSRDLISWSRPSLLLITRTLYDSACGEGALRSYPVLIDETAEGRNFEDIGDQPWLAFSEMRIDGCKHTGDRKLVLQKVEISARP